jgi:hypothetical protein
MTPPTDGNCHICGKPNAGPGEPICSYPHGMVPIKPVDPRYPDGFWEWGDPMEKDEAKS